MQNFVAKFSIYDHLGYIFVGLYQIILLTVMHYIVFGDGARIVRIFSILTVGNFIFLVLLAYLGGHIIQAIANVFIKENKDDNNPDFNHIYERAKTFFNLPQDVKSKYIFQYCYLYALANDGSGHVELFNSRYSFYRGLFTSSLIILLIACALFLFSMTTHILSQFPAWDLSVLFYAFVFSNMFLLYLFNNRKDRFYKYLGEKVFIAFDIASKQK